ncbi:FAD-dependent monooxygenase [Streptomyces sp. NPDC086023]|uniref:FAD-dependent monooxygenase n=1 Tax=Streptomyces sp. NPDC086023 TaxID=3365746 RepID=UPI0037D27A10
MLHPKTRGPDRDGPHIAVVGAGIAGLTLAVALARAGLRCDVYEQTRRMREVGAGVQIAPNASRLLHRLGLGERLRELAVRPSAVEMRRWDDGALLGRTALGAECEELYGAPYYTVHRADLHQQLLCRLADGSLHIGLRCVGAEEDADGAVLRFEDGSVRRADLVVGADGIHSVVREALAPDEPRFSGQSIYRGLVPSERLPFLMADPKVRLWLGPEQHLVCYPVSGGRLISFGATAPAGDWTAESWTADGRVDELALTYTGWNPDVRKIVEAPDAVGRWALHDRDPIDRWTTGRIALLGDAAHPMLPFMAQGANQAVEDAVVLAGCLAGAEAGPDGLRAALVRYEELRRPRTELIQRQSRANSAKFHLSDGDGQRERDAELAGSQNLREQEWLYGHDAEAALAGA